MKNLVMLMAFIFSLSSFAQGYSKKLNLKYFGYHYDTSDEDDKDEIIKKIFNKPELEITFKAFDTHIENHLDHKLAELNSKIRNYIKENTFYLREDSDIVNKFMTYPDRVKASLIMSYESSENKDHYKLSLDRKDLLFVGYTSQGVGFTTEAEVVKKNFEFMFKKSIEEFYDDLINLIKKEENRLRAEKEGKDILKDYGSININESERGLKKDVKEKLKLVPQSQKANLI